MALDFLAGCAGGVAGVLVGHPFDTVKAPTPATTIFFVDLLLTKVRPGPAPHPATPSYSAPPGVPSPTRRGQVRLQVQSTEKPQYRGTLHCFQSIIKQESVLGLYKGLGSPLMGLTFINALVFGVQGNTLRALGRDTPLNQFVAGAAAGAIQCVICCPMELAKTRLQLQDAGPGRTYRGSLHCLAQIYRREGLRGVNRGMTSTLLRETPSFGVYFLSYDVLTRALGCEPGDRLLVPKLLLAGGTSGILSWLSTYPVDVVKSRLQADGVRGPPRYGGFVDCVRQSYRAEGWRVFTRGLASTLSGAACALCTPGGWPGTVRCEPPGILTVPGTGERAAAWDLFPRSLRSGGAPGALLERLPLPSASSSRPPVAARATLPSLASEQASQLLARRQADEAPAAQAAGTFPINPRRRQAAELQSSSQSSLEE
ncbi:mitochondrial basic amino acids transporter [Suricata suricatta]|uniref:mitochondrial basic amino acids transporter n=1 Tax=Suricata suricatta TaxID=37032 RepID=UPI0011554851|nr:mitochondrial basic amino acids transporter [Suricata suricatta]